jgi:short-subunit dehydrogenase
MAAATRSALITGASSGIGLSIATMLGELGYDLSIVARNPRRLEAARDLLSANGSSVVPIIADLSEQGAAYRIIEAHLAEYHRLDTLVHSAGVGLFGTLEAQSKRQVDLQLDLNLRCLMELVRGGLPALKKAGGEHGKALVVAISSMVGVQPQPGVVPYGVTKAAQRAFCEGAHVECAQHGVQFTALCPALVETPGAQWADSDVKLSPEDVTAAVRFLLDTSTACFIPEIQLRTAGAFGLGG